MKFEICFWIGKVYFYKSLSLLHLFPAILTFDNKQLLIDDVVHLPICCETLCCFYRKIRLNNYRILLTLYFQEDHFDFLSFDPFI